MHSLIEVDVSGPAMPAIVRNVQDCSPTEEVDCEDGAGECTSKASTTNMRWSGFRCGPCGPAFTFVSVDLTAAANNPCFARLAGHRLHWHAHG